MSRSVTREATHTSSLLYYLRKVRFTCGESLWPRHHEFQKYHDHDYSYLYLVLQDTR